MIPSVHVSLMKKFLSNEESPRVQRVTSVFEPDTPSDNILDRYSEVKVSGTKLVGKQAEDITVLEDKFKDILTKEPGLTNLVEFGINTGDHESIFQRAYNTPAELKESVDKEIEWLLEKGFIRPSDSSWASPMVTVRVMHAYALILSVLTLSPDKHPFTCLAWRKF